MSLTVITAVFVLSVFPFRSMAKNLTVCGVAVSAQLKILSLMANLNGPQLSVEPLSRLAALTVTVPVAESRNTVMFLVTAVGATASVCLINKLLESKHPFESFTFDLIPDVSVKFKN